jgi:hypothetical protein
MRDDKGDKGGCGAAERFSFIGFGFVLKRGNEY